MKFKILFITHCLDMGGGNKSLLQLMKELKEPPYNIDPILLASTSHYTNQSNNIIVEAEKVGIKSIGINFYPFKAKKYNYKSVIAYFINIISLFKIYLKIKKENIDIIHSNSSIIDIGAYLSKILKKKHIWHLREFGDEDFHLHSIWGQSYEKLIYECGDIFIAISQKIKQRFMLVIPENKIKLVYNGLPPIEQNKSDFSDNKIGDIINICISGNLNSAKRQIDAIEAMKILVNIKGIKNIRLYIIGDGIDKTLLLRKVKEYNLTSFIYFTGWIKDPALIYKRCNIGLMLSENEGFGRVTIDYMRNKLAIIASNGGANPELIKDNKTGLLFNTKDVNALVDLIDLLITNPNKIKELGRNAYNFSLNHFISINNTKEIFEIYTEVIDS